MNRLLRVVALTAIYLLVLTSVHPGDVLTGAVLSVLLVAAGRRIRPLGRTPARPGLRRLAGVPVLLGGTLVDLVASTWRTAMSRCRWTLPSSGPGGTATIGRHSRTPSGRRR